MTKNVLALVIGGRRARILRVLGRKNGGCRLEAFRLSASRGVKRWLSEGVTNNTDAKAEQIVDDPQRIRALLHEDALEFVHEILEELAVSVHNGQLDQLIIVAEPQIMLLLRQQLPLSLVVRLIFTHEMIMAHLSETDLLESVLQIIDERD
jgi:protein required for attachment to host cells